MSGLSTFPVVVKPLSICSWQRVKQHRCKLLLVVFVVKQDRITYVVSSRLNSGLKLTLAQTKSQGQLKITLSSLQSMFWWPKLIYVSGLIFDANAYCYACHSRFACLIFLYVEYNFTNKSLVMFECFSNLFKWLPSHAEQGWILSVSRDLNHLLHNSCIFCSIAVRYLHTINKFDFKDAWGKWIAAECDCPFQSTSNIISCCHLRMFSALTARVRTHSWNNTDCPRSSLHTAQNR